MTTAALMMQRKIDAREVGLRGRVHFIRLSARSVLRVCTPGVRAPRPLSPCRDPASRVWPCGARAPGY